MPKAYCHEIAVMYAGIKSGTKVKMNRKPFPAKLKWPKKYAKGSAIKKVQITTQHDKSKLLPKRSRIRESVNNANAENPSLNTWANRFHTIAINGNKTTNRKTNVIMNSDVDVRVVCLIKWLI